jgi:hypothetical protein
MQKICKNSTKRSNHKTANKIKHKNIHIMAIKEKENQTHNNI